MTPFFSILVVCLNAGDKLKQTITSILAQDFADYEIVVKDGGSVDGSLDFLKRQDIVTDGLTPAMEETEHLQRLTEEGRLQILQKKDSGIYDAMNQAAEAARGSYVYFLNCGDLFAEKDVLSKIHGLILEKPAMHGIYYGNIYERLTGQCVASNPSMDAFGCYRNVPCHQACFYQRELLLAHPFDTGLAVRADYEQFLACFFAGYRGKKVTFTYGEILVCDYEGGGFSETRENRKRSEREHRIVTERYMSKGQIRKYRFLLAITLAPLRTWISHNEKTAGIYNAIKKRIYK